jgi:hypothetical protein
MTKAKANTALRVGQSIRLTPTGTVYTVTRVTPCSATIKSPDAAPETEGQTISAHAFVYSL